ncbi:DUF4297 domain-containing protein [Pontibacter russatus]|uniref:DUF4297 domain-containing protein n=1 Tax=Pontibacter russatus TaxID=2694929 RepID=UPI001379C41F|nr:DUF4297 domain-containing protein [Pontibacter russatus]
MVLKDKIVSTRPREKSGSTSSSRFNYQKDWSLCKLIETHTSLSDYVIIFDWHEDLIIMDSEHDPKTVQFYQIKGKKSGNWTLKKLIEAEKGKNGKVLLSIIGKLYDCKAKYDIETTSLNFISNARFSVDLEDKTSSLSKDNICVVELSVKNKAEILSRLKTEHSLMSDPVYEDITFLKVIDLSLDESSGHAKGKITDFLDGLYPEKKFNVPSVYRMLFDEVKRRANYNKETLTYKDLISNKAIGKSQFERIIKATGIDKNYDALWSDINNELISDCVTFSERKKLNHNWKKLEIERMEPNNDYLFKHIEQIRIIVQEEENNNGFVGITLSSCVENVLAKFKSSMNLRTNYDEYYIKAMILSEIYE